MGGIQSLISNIGMIERGVGLISNLAGSEIDSGEQQAAQDLALRQLQQRQSEDMRQSQEDANLARMQLAAQAEAAEDTRRKSLRRAVSRQSAIYGGNGISSGNGSAQAVLLGLFDESDDERAERERMDSLKLGALDLGLEQQSRLNLIQREQMRESQRINNLSSSYGRTTRGLDFGLGTLKLLGDISGR